MQTGLQASEIERWRQDGLIGTPARHHVGLFQRISRNLALFACILRFAYGRQFGD
jgi:hypothetical protein